ncbi:hypothetical protein M9428_30945 (plasmid) [Bacillus bombysepticus]|nr:hypothetical protein [Bacillus cereus]MCD2338688.1 hypothetical protein [Bacillus cereus]
MNHLKGFKKVLILGLLCLFVFSLSACDFVDGFKNGFSSKTEKVDTQDKK